MGTAVAKHAAGLDELRARSPDTGQAPGRRFSRAPYILYSVRAGPYMLNSPVDGTLYKYAYSN
jgi:hypothetical protein